MMKTLALTLSCILLKWPNILQKYYGVHTARFSKYVLQFSNIMHEVRKDNKIIGGHKNESKKKSTQQAITCLELDIKNRLTVNLEL